MNITDSMDEKIVRLLGQNARQSSEELAKQLNISAATVRRRLNRLLDNGLLHIVGVVDPRDFGLALAVFISLDVSHESLETVVEDLAKMQQIRWVSTCTGRFDVIALGRFRSTDALSDFITKELSKMDGVKNIETFICLNVKKANLVTLT